MALPETYFPYNAAGSHLPTTDWEWFNITACHKNWPLCPGGCPMKDGTKNGRVLNVKEPWLKTALGVRKSAHKIPPDKHIRNKIDVYSYLGIRIAYFCSEALATYISREPLITFFLLLRFPIMDWKEVCSFLGPASFPSCWKGSCPKAPNFSFFRAHHNWQIHPSW